MKIAIVGVTGAVGREMIEVLEARAFPVSELVPFASVRNEGKSIAFAGKTYRCQVLKKGCFKDVQVAFFDASDEVSQAWVPEAVQSGALVIDNSAVSRMNPEIPLVVPEVNAHAIGSHRLIAGPNCTTAQLVVALKPLSDHFGLKRVVVSTYQSVSGAGTIAIEELKSQIGSAGPHKAVALKHPIAFNLIPHIGSFDCDGNTSEENKVVAETKKILGLPDLKISCTAVRVPTMHCHAESVNVEFQKPCDVELAKKLLAGFPGIELQDDPSKNLYPMNLTSTKKNPVFVGRVRRDLSVENGLQFWVVSDNLRKGAALNAVQIAERVIHA